MPRQYTSLPYTEYNTTAYDTNRELIDRIVIHSTVCTTQAAINTFSSPTAKTSAHYIIGNDGKLWAGLEEYNVAYHSGNYPMNQRSIGIEHEWYAGIHPSDALYAKSAALVKDICNFYNIPINSTTIIPHKQVVATGCPNEIDVAKIISLAGGASLPSIEECPAKLIQITAERDRLNKIIGEDKDPEIKRLNETIAKMASDATLLQSQYNTLALKEQECQKQALIYKEAYDALPSLKEVVSHLEETKVKQAAEISELTKQVGYWQTKYGNLKKPGLKFLQSAVIAICEKLGVQI